MVGRRCDGDVGRLRRGNEVAEGVGAGRWVGSVFVSVAEMRVKS